MRFNPALNEAITSQNPEPQRPVLRLIQGDGITDGAPNAVRPELYIVPHPDDSLVDEGAQESVLDANGDTASLPDRRFRGALEAGSRLMKAAVPESVTVPGKTYQKKAGGGRWLIEMHLAKLKAEAKARAEAEGHETNCICRTCRNF